MPSCPSCQNADLDPDFLFCPKCATDLRPHHLKYACCGKSSLAAPGNFCPFCGEKTS